MILIRDETILEPLQSSLKLGIIPQPIDIVEMYIQNKTRSKISAMTQGTETDIREIKDLILGLDKKIEAIDKKVDIGFANADRKMEVGFANIETKLARLDGRIDTLETTVLGKFETVNAKITNLEIRVWVSLSLRIERTWCCRDN
jgi:hypothetical protein